jgi:hypothetical protein
MAAWDDLLVDEPGSPSVLAPDVPFTSMVCPAAGQLTDRHGDEWLGRRSAAKCWWLHGCFPF